MPQHPSPGNNASTSTPMAIPIAVSMEAIVIPCSLNSVRIFSPNEVSLSNTLAIVSLKLVIWDFSLPFRRSIDSCQFIIQSINSFRDVFSHCVIVFSIYYIFYILYILYYIYYILYIILYIYYIIYYIYYIIYYILYIIYYILYIIYYILYILYYISIYYIYSRIPSEFLELSALCSDVFFQHLNF